MVNISGGTWNMCMRMEIFLMMKIYFLSISIFKLFEILLMKWMYLYSCSVRINMDMRMSGVLSSDNSRSLYINFNQIPIIAPTNTA